MHQARAKTAESGFRALAGGFGDFLETGDAKAFNENIVKPLDIANRAFSGDPNQTLNITEGSYSYLKAYRGETLLLRPNSSRQ